MSAEVIGGRAVTVAAVASSALEAVRGKIASALAAAQLVQQHVVDVQAAEGRKRAAKEKSDGRAAALVERAARAEAELALATRRLST